jgi:hypothetical protein
MRLDILAAILDQLYTDRAFVIEKGNVLKYAQADINDMYALQEQLSIWESEQKLVQLKPLSECNDAEPCIRLIAYLLPNLNRRI